MTTQSRSSPARRLTRGSGPVHSAGGVSRRRRLPGWVLGVSTIIVILAVLEVLSRIGVFSNAFPPVSEDFKELFKELGRGEFWGAVGQTMQGWGIGLAIAAGMAIPLGIIIGASTLTYHAFRAIIEFMRPVPSVALLPFALLVYGIGLESTLFLVVFGAFWPILIQTLYGVRDVDPVTTDTARVFGFGPVSRLWRVTFFSTIPYIATGLRLASTVSLLLAVTAELIIGSPGLGYVISLAQNGAAYPLMYALMIATGLIGWILNTIFMIGEKRVLHWHPAYRASGK